MTVSDQGFKEAIDLVFSVLDDERKLHSDDPESHYTCHVIDFIKKSIINELKHSNVEINFKYCGYCDTSHSENFHADFCFLMNHDVIAIIDENKGNKSVTNDIEYVLYTIKKNYELLAMPNPFKGLIHYKIIYKDSMGAWDKVLVDDEDQFIDFKPVENGKVINNINEAFKLVSTEAMPL